MSAGSRRVLVALTLASFASVAFFVSGGAIVACSSSEDATPVTPTDDASTTPEDSGTVTPTTDAGPTSDGSTADVTGPRPPSSGGKGGLTCTRQHDLGAGRSACVVKVGNVELEILTPKPTTAPLRLGVYVHGDGAAAYKSGSALKAMFAWSDANAGLAVAALAPNGCAWWLAPTHDCTTTGEGDPDVTAANAPQLASAIDAIMKAYDVRTDGVRYYGSSGGSIFLTDEWIPLYGAKYPGVFALMCGGVSPSQDFAWDPTDATLRAKDPLFYTYGDQDFLVPEIDKSVAAFQEDGFAITKKIVPGAEHCAFDAHGEAVGIWSANP